MDQKGPHSSETYVNRFGSWRAAVEDAGFDVTEFPSENAETEGTISGSHQKADEKDGEPSSLDETGHGKSIPSPCPVEWCDQVSPSRVARRDHMASHPSDVVRQALARDLRELSEELGHPPTSSEIAEAGATEFQLDTYSEWFESWTDALRFSGLPPWKNRTEEDYALALIRLAEKLERPPTTEEMDEQGQYSAAGYITRFGSWSSALYLAGLSEQDVSEAAWDDFVEERDTGFDDISGEIDDVRESVQWGSTPPEELTEQDRELISSLREFIEEFGEIPTPAQLDLYGPEKSHVYIERYGTWAGALELAKENPGL